MPSTFGFDRSKRLVRPSDFQRAFSQGSRARGSVLVVVVRRNGLAHTRLGLSVGRTVWRDAVRRNRVRRIFREAFRLSYPELPDGVDVVLIAAGPKLVPELEATRKELVTLARKALRRFDEKVAGAPGPQAGRAAAGQGPGPQAGEGPARKEAP